MKLHRKLMMTYIYQFQNQGYFMDLLKDGAPTLRPILLAISTPIYKQARFCDKLLKQITADEYAIKDSFSFIREVEEFDPNLVMVSFDVISFLTNITSLHHFNVSP